MKYIIQTASAPYVNGYGNYRRIAILAVEDGVEKVSRISNNAKGVISIVDTWEHLNVGRTERGAYQRAMAKAVAQCAELNERLRATQASILAAFNGE